MGFSSALALCDREGVPRERSAAPCLGYPCLGGDLITDWFSLVELGAVV